MTTLSAPLETTPETKYVKLTRLGRNLRPGDEICVSEDLIHKRSGRVRVTSVKKFPAWRSGIRCGATEYQIFHSGPCTGDLTRMLWTGTHWGEMRCDAKTTYDIFRPIPV